MKSCLKLIIILVFVAVTCFGMTACISYTSQTRYDDADNYLAGSQTYDAADLTGLNIDWKKGKVVLVEDESATCVTVTEDNALSDEKKVHSYYHDGVLEIKFWKSGLRDQVSEKDKCVTIVYRSVHDLDIHMTSGDLIADKVTVERAKIEITSGEIDIKRVQANDCECKMTSGDIKLGELTSENVTLKLTSGNLSLGDVRAETVTHSQTSGNTRIQRMETGSFTSQSTSGDVDVSFARVQRVSLTMTSGDAEIGLPEGGATVSVAMTSGSFKTDLTYVVNMGKYIFGDGQCELGIKMTSGSVRIK